MWVYGPKYETGTNSMWAGAGRLGLVLTGTRTVSALGRSATQVWMDCLVLTTQAVSNVLCLDVRLVWGFDGRGQKSEVALAFLPSL
jgi:hypothetical protein